jgi:hypothetical protein
MQRRIQVTVSVKLFHNVQVSFRTPETGMEERNVCRTYA